MKVCELPVETIVSIWPGSRRICVRRLPGRKATLRWFPRDLSEAAGGLFRGDIWRAERTAEFNEANEGQAAPFILVGNALKHQRRFVFGVIDQGCQVFAFAF